MTLAPTAWWLFRADDGTVPTVARTFWPASEVVELWVRDEGIFPPIPHDKVVADPHFEQSTRAQVDQWIAEQPERVTVTLDSPLNADAVVRYRRKRRK